MYAVSPSVEDLIARLKRVLEGFSISLAILFESYARRQPSRMSDVDLLVEGDFNRSKLVMSASKHTGIPVEKIDLMRVEELPVKVLARVLNEDALILCKEPKALISLSNRVTLEYPEMMEGFTG